MPHAYEFSSSQSGSQTYAHDGGAPSWSLGGGNSMAVTGPTVVGHHRHPSTSSIGSVASTASTPFPRGMRGSGDFTSGKGVKATYAKQRQPSTSRTHLPTPQGTPTRHSFASSRPQSFSQEGQALDQTAQASMLMNSAMMSHVDDHAVQAARKPVAMQTPPAIERTSATPQLVHQDSMSAALIPKFNRTLTDAYQDNLYFAQPAAASQNVSSSSYLTPNQIINDRLLEAQMARSQSSSSNQSMSPFRNYAQVDGQYQTSPQGSVEPKTISPKEAMLDYNPNGNDYSLFPQTTAALGQAYATAQPVRADLFNGSNDLNYNNQAWSASMQQAFTTAPMQFATPALPTTLSMGPSFTTINGSQNRSTPRQFERTPEFTPAQLTRMESSASEAPQSSQASSQIVVSPKPVSAADSGTYSCTFHGCAQRFTTPQKLQKHKRDSHRNVSNVTPGVGSGMTTAQLMERNSQSGPHICSRMNPTTGKPCEAIFSRPYDLTRHEDTIHNIRKQKVKCAICTEDKTFSRSDALTRHMRVVHPEVDFPGKHRKRGSRDDN